jgi:hypothetical protein
MAVTQKGATAIFLSSFVPHLHTVTRCVRRDYFIHNTASFVSLRKLRFTAFGSIVSAVPYCFSGCAFAQPLGLAPFREKRHFALNQGTPRKSGSDFYFFPNVSRSQYYTFVPQKSVTSFPSCGGCSIAATPPLRSSYR